MKFDVRKALSDTFSTQVSLLDRLVSYLYFSDLSVSEQTVLDQFGRGVSLVAQKNVEKSGKHILLATALPLSLRFPKSPKEIVYRGGHYLDCARFIDIVAKVAVCSDIAKHKVTFVAYRPDPTATCFREILASLDDRIDFACVYAPVGLIPRTPKVSMALIRIDYTAKSRRKLLKPTKDVLQLRALNTSGEQSFLQDFLELLFDLEGKRQIQVLSVDANTGSDFFASSEVVAKVATHVDNLDLPENLQTMQLSIAPVHPCSVALQSAIKILKTLKEEIYSQDQLTRATLHPIRAELIGDNCRMDVVFCADKAISEELVNAIEKIEGVSEVLISSCTKGDEWDGLPVGSFPFVQQVCTNSVVMGTSFEDSMDDPVLAGEKALLAYRSVLRQFL